MSEIVEAFKAFKVSDDLSEHPVLPQIGVDFYSCLLRLTEQIDHTIFPYVDFFELTPQCPKSWLEVKERVARIVEQKPIAERLKAIDEIRNGLSSVGNPDRLYLGAIADRLYEKINKLQGSAESTKLCFFPVPKLTDRVCDIEERTCEFCIQIDNRSDAPGFKIRMKVEDEQSGTIEGTQTSVETINKKDTMTAGPVEIPQRGATLRIVASYLDQEARECQGRSETFRIADLKKGSADDITKDNPYNEDIPYRKGDIFVGRKRDEDNLLKIFKTNPEGCILYLWGLRRVGKTSLIYHFNDKGEKSSPRYSNIYFPCTLFERNDNSWTNEDFLGIVARRVRLRLIELGHVDNGDIQSCPEGPVNSLDFFNFINQVRGLLGDMNLILVFDDAEVFGKDLGDKPKEQRLFPDFGNILRDFKTIIGEKSLKCGGIFFMFVGCKDVLGKFLPESVTSCVSNSIAITLLNMEATREIANVKLSYDDIAFEYLWRVTGGHPSLTQLICWHVKDTLIKNNSISENISLYMVRKAVASLTENPNAVGYFQYLYQFSIPPNMHDTLHEIVQRVDPETLQFDAAGLDKNDLNHLAYYEILSQNDDKYALRLGFLKLWIDKLGDKDE